ncbi:carbamoyl-phosphate synthase large subunit [Pediococcus parvulus]|uniref:ATP-grasp domain-containing protein n=1 Tax=Pediococcus parvulus TaxID=54062 RepID=A0AAP5WE85_9LACO|nr:ATP-grasp domain-containing protein [Pediococcus parvulus]MDV7694879.1 ATP-grasp domain-containing protein [Pediococcus parvulus]OAD63613.1 carbamoyl-phosphate synthase large subunit [Pediococcus parvulus]
MARTKLQKIVIIGSGPNEIGMDTELETATLQTIQELHKAGKEVTFVSNNANSVAGDYLDPEHFIISNLDANSLITILRNNEFDGLIPTLGGTPIFQLLHQLDEAGIFNQLNIRVLGVSLKTIANTQNPEALNRILQNIHEPYIPTNILSDTNEVLKFVRRIGYPVIVKPVAAITNNNRMRCENEHQLKQMLASAFRISTTHQVAVEKSIVGFKEIEMTVIRDNENTRMLICAAEDFNPVGVHAGDSIVFTPTQTLTDQEFQAIRSSALRIVQEFKIRGICHIQFALNQSTGNYYVIRVNPYFDRTTAFAARATGYPVALVCTQISFGRNLRSITIPGLRQHDSLALIEPTLDHIAVRFPTFSFASFANANQELNTRMKSTGSVIAFGRSTEEATLKAIRSVDSTTTSEQAALDESRLNEGQLINVLVHPTAGEVFYLLEAIRRGYQVEELAELTKIDAFYFYKLIHIVQIEKKLRKHPFDVDVLRNAKYYGYGDSQIAQLWKCSDKKVRDFRETNQIRPTFKGIEPTAGEFPYNNRSYYTTFETENESQISEKPKVFILGTANNQVGTNAAAEYVTVHTIQACQKLGFETILINNNPSAISILPRLADKLYLEPLTVENCLNIMNSEQPDFVIAQGKWQIVTDLETAGVKITQLPLSRTSRAENVESNYLVVAEKMEEKQRNLGCFDTAEDASLHFPSSAKKQISNKLQHISLSELSKQEDGIYSVMFKQEGSHLIVTGTIPLAIQDIPFMTYALNYDIVADMVKLILKRSNCESPLKLTSQNVHLKLEHVFPYNQLQIPEPQNPPFSLAIGARITSTKL